MEIRLQHARKDPWSGFMKYNSSCFTGICAPLSRAGNRLTGLEPEDERRLEKALGYPEGHLARTSRFWVTYTVRVPKEGLILDTDVPEHEMMYKLAMANPRVAKNMGMINPSTDFVIINREAEAEESNKRNKTKREAMACFTKMSPNEIKQALRIYGFSSDNVSPDVAEQKLFDHVEANPSKFLTLWVNNANRDTQALLEQAIAKNVIRKQRNVYYYGTDVIGRSLDDAIASLDDKNNQDVRIAIMQETESK